MADYFDQIPDSIKNHVREITKRSGLPDNDESLEKISEGWLEKKKIFEEETSKLKMSEIEVLEKDNEKGALILTYSGSLINLGPLINGVRKVSYASIGLRQDVPELASHDKSELLSDIKIDESIDFKAGPVKKTSQVFKISFCPQDISASEQENKLTKAATIIMDDFVEVNKTIIAE